MIKNLYAIIRLQELQDQESKKIENASSQFEADIAMGRLEAFTDAEFILKYADCYTKDGFNKELASKLRETIYQDGNQRYEK